ncbi:MAG: helix-turn-helix domain-containing protein [Deltaproteobacteria bacterium]
MLLNLKYVRQLMEEKGWSVRELARRADISYATVSRVLNNKRGAGARTLAGMRKAFPNEPTDKLFFLD